MTKIAVVTGGQSSEREVSLRSGKAVANALESTGHDVELIDLGSDLSEHLVAMRAADVVFPVLHGAGGEDGILQAYLEEQGIRYVGSDSKASALCFDKWRYREVVVGAELPMAAGALVRIDNFASNPLVQSPYVLKPLNGGSSIDTYVVRDIADAPREKIAETFGRYPTMLLEQLIVGVELTVGVLDNEPLPIIEIIPPEQGEFDYENKYNGATQELCPPKHVDEAVQLEAQALALKAHRLAGCRDLSRTDIMYEGTTGKLYLLETNTIPGMTDQSLFPKMAATKGIPMAELCDRLVDMALQR